MNNELSVIDLLYLRLKHFIERKKKKYFKKIIDEAFENGKKEGLMIQIADTFEDCFSSLPEEFELAKFYTDATGFVLIDEHGKPSAMRKFNGIRCLLKGDILNIHI